MASLVLKNIRKVYPAAEKRRGKRRTGEPDFVAVQNFDLEIADKEFIVLVGPSGCGKSTTLRMIAGLEDITSGELFIDGKLVNDIPPKDRDIAMVFQSYALYPHMTVYENMAFPLKLKKLPKAEIEQIVHAAAESLDITDLLQRKPKALSGGQRQRVAIGRAIVRDPKVLLMDEPLSNLDARLRNQMRAEIIRLHQRINTTFVYVTHDQTEAMTLADRIVIMKDGYIQQIGTPQEVFDHPADLFVAGFIGSPQMNFFDNAGLVKKGERYFVVLGDQQIQLPEDRQRALAENDTPEQDMILGVRPEHIALKPGFSGTVSVAELMGSSVHLHITALGQNVVAVISTMNMTNAEVAALSGGAEVQFGFSGHSCHLFSKETGCDLEKRPMDRDP